MQIVQKYIADIKRCVQDFSMSVESLQLAGCTHACTWPPVRINTWPVDKVKNILALL